MRPWIRRLRFSWIFAPGGRLSYEAYNVERYDTYSPKIKTRLSYEACNVERYNTYNVKFKIIKV